MVKHPRTTALLFWRYPYRLLCSVARAPRCNRVADLQAQVGHVPRDISCVLARVIRPLASFARPSPPSFLSGTCSKLISSLMGRDEPGRCARFLISLSFHPPAAAAAAADGWARCAAQFFLTP